MKTRFRLTKSDLRTAQTVLDNLPGHAEPLGLTPDEARDIGYWLAPEAANLVVDADPKAWEMAKVVLESMGRGFYFCAIHAMPDWIYNVWELKFDDTIGDKDRLEAVCEEIESVSDPVRLSKCWVMLCCGFDEDSVIEYRMEEEAAEQAYNEISDSLKKIRTPEDVLQTRANKLEEM